MRLDEVKFGRKYRDRRLGEVLLCGPHPYDGACLIVERLDDPDVVLSFDATEACCLIEEIPG